MANYVSINPLRPLFYCRPNGIKIKMPWGETFTIKKIDTALAAPYNFSMGQ